MDQAASDARGTEKNFSPHAVSYACSCGLSIPNLRTSMKNSIFVIKPYHRSTDFADYTDERQARAMSTENEALVLEGARAEIKEQADVAAGGFEVTDYRPGCRNPCNRWNLWIRFADHVGSVAR
jgi:hypothetical protein